MAGYREQTAHRVPDLASLSADIQRQHLDRIKRLEKRCFPSSELFDFDLELRKRNTHVLVALSHTSITTTNEEVTGYLVYLRRKSTTLLHKICVAPEQRRVGVARAMMKALIVRLEREGCHDVQLWVDEAREPARALYESFGFQQTNVVEDYYGNGRNGLKMMLELE